MYEWICLFIDVYVLCLSHSSGLVWPTCKHACTLVATKLQENTGNGNAGGDGGLFGNAKLFGPLEKAH